MRKDPVNEELIVADENPPIKPLHAPEGQPQEPLPQGKKTIPVIAIIVAASILVFFFGAFIIINSALTRGPGAAMNSFESSLESSMTEIQEKTQGLFADFTESIYHVKNVADIQIGDLQKCSNLEVLKIRETELNVVNGENELTDITSWIEVVETCEYVVDLSSAEFLIDNVRNTVTVRAPQPELKNFTIEKSDVLFSYSSFIAGSAGDGSELVNRQIREADEAIREKVKNNQEYFDTARNTAVTMITGAITSLNENVENLVVNVEFTG